MRSRISQAGPVVLSNRVRVRYDFVLELEPKDGKPLTMPPELTAVLPFVAGGVFTVLPRSVLRKRYRRYGILPGAKFEIEVLTLGRSHKLDAQIAKDQKAAARALARDEEAERLPRTRSKKGGRT